MSAPSGAPRDRAVDHLVIGGGPAGAMVGLKLAEAGRQVTLIEKERAAHDKVCGEFLSQEAVAYLRQSGISARDLGAVPIRIVGLSAGGASAEARLPFSALSLSRRVLDEALLVRAARQGCETIRGSQVEGLGAESGGWVARLSGGAAIRARNVFLATGKHDLRGWGRDGGVQGDLIGFKLHWRLAAAQTQELRERMQLFLFPGGYGGLSLAESEVANLCLVVRRPVWRKYAGWSEFLDSLLKANDGLRQRLAGAEPLWARPLAVSPIPYGYLARRRDGVWRVGDQAAVIPSFTGDGMSIALHSGSLAAEMFLSGETADAYQHALGEQLGGPMRLATWISRALVAAAGRKLAVPGASIVPGALRWIAAVTRIPPEALLPGNGACTLTE